MSAVDDRIVAMKFDNKQFEPAVKTSLSTLDRLKAALNFTNAGKGLNDLQSSASRFTLGGLGSAADGVAGKFSAMSVVAIAALASITAKAVDAGLQIAKALTIDPAKQGFAEYELQMGSIQTILANTQAAGTNLKDVNDTLKELNQYSDQTIYNFGEMAKNIGTFTAAGVDLKTSTAAIKGIANLAALSGSNSQQASTAMYQLSQAISSGKVSLQDWNSVVNAGMGGTVFQRALAQTAEKMGTLEKGSVKLSGKMKNATINGQSFRESITAKPGEKSWLTSDVLTKTLQQFTGDMSDAELAAMGFSQAQIKSIQEQAATAKNAATQVKTFTQLIGTLQESSGSGWAQTFQIVLGDFEEAKKLFTEINNIAGAFIQRSADARNKMLQDWKDLGGRASIIESIRNIFEAVVKVAEPISKAFRDIFPATTGKQLYALTVRFEKFTENLKIGANTANDVRRTARGLFAAFDIGIQVVSAVARVVGKLFGYLSNNSGSFLDITGDVGDFIVSLDKAIKKGDLIYKFFMSLDDAVRNPIASLKRLAGALGTFFSSLKGNPFGDLTKYLGRFRDRLAPLAKLATQIASAWKFLVGVFKSFINFLKPIVEAIGRALSGIGKSIAKAFESGDFSQVYDALNAGLLTGILLMIRKFFKQGMEIPGGGLIQAITDTFGELTNTLKTMQTQIQAKTLLLIAGAVALLTASVLTLSMIDSENLAKGLSALAISFAQLMAAMAIMTKIAGAGGFAQLPAMAGSMILLATAVLILSSAIKKFAGLSWNDLMKGLVGVAGVLALMVGAALLLDKASGSMIRAGLAMIPLAVGLKILQSSVKGFAKLSWGDIVRGLIAMGGALTLIIGAMMLLPKGAIAQVAAFDLLAIAITGIALAMKILGGMSWEEIGKSMVMLLGALVLLAAGLYAMTGSLPGAAALLVAAGALFILAPALILMTKMSWEEIGKGMVILAGSLLILAGGLTLMAGSIAGAAALTVAAFALGLLVPVLATLGNMSWDVIKTGLLAIAAALGTIGLSALLLTPAIPSLLLLSAALLALGVSMTFIGVGALALATAFSIFAAAGTAGVATLLAMIGLIPALMTKFAQGIIGFVTTLASESTEFTKAFATLLGTLFDALVKVAPKMERAVNAVVTSVLNILLKNTPRIADAAYKLVIAIMTTISRNIGNVVAIFIVMLRNIITNITRNIPTIARLGANMIIKFMNAIATEIPRLADAGAKALVKFLNGVAKAIRDNKEAVNRAGRNIGSAIIEGMVSGIRSNISWVAGWARKAAESALNAAKNFLGINSPSKEFMKIGVGTNEGFALGIRNSVGLTTRATEKVGKTTLGVMNDIMSNLAGTLPSDMNIAPVITPVMDLTKVTQDASKINSLVGQTQLSSELTFKTAQDINAKRSNIDDFKQQVSEEGSGNTYQNFEQTNNSPKALSAAEIYKNTKSVLSMAKKEVYS